MRPIDVMRRFLDKDERNNPTELNKFIQKYVPAFNGLSVKTTAWCMAMVNACLGEVGKKGTGKLNARSGLDLGEKIDLEDAQEGDIAIFARGNSGWEGHIGFINKVIPKVGGPVLEIIGGNQTSDESGKSDEVNIARYTTQRLLGIRRV